MIKVISEVPVNGGVNYTIYAPAYWWIHIFSQNLIQVKNIKRQEEIVSDSFDFDLLYTTCEDEDLGSTKVAFYLIQLLNKYKTRFKSTHDQKDLYQIVSLTPLSLMIQIDGFVAEQKLETFKKQMENDLLNQIQKKNL